MRRAHICVLCPASDVRICFCPNTKAEGVPHPPSQCGPRPLPGIIVMMERRFGRKSIKQVAAEMVGLWPPKVSASIHASPDGKEEGGATSGEVAEGGVHKEGHEGEAAPPSIDLSYAVVNIQESLPDDKTSYGDSLELKSRDKLRRLVKWMDGSGKNRSSRTVPTLSEVDSVVDSLLSKYLGSPDALAPTGDGAGGSFLSSAAAAAGGGVAAAAAAAAEGDDAVPLEKRACTVCPPGVPCALFSLAPPRRAPRVRPSMPKPKSSNTSSVLPSQSHSPAGSVRDAKLPVASGSMSLGKPRVPRRQNSRLFAGMNMDPSGEGVGRRDRALFLLLSHSYLFCSRFYTWFP